MAVHIIFRYLSVNVGRISHCLLIRGSLFLDTPCCALLARPRCTAASHITHNRQRCTVTVRNVHTPTHKSTVILHPPRLALLVSLVHFHATVL